jgi:hypothetical protein
MAGFGSLFVYTFSVSVKPLAAEFGWSRAAISSGFAIAAVTLGMARPGRSLDLSKTDSEFPTLRYPWVYLQPSAAEPHRRNCPRADQTGQRQGCEKFPGTIDTVLCYRLTSRKPLLLLKHCLDNMFVTEEASFVLRSLPFTNNAGECPTGSSNWLRTIFLSHPIG